MGFGDVFSGISDVWGDVTGSNRTANAVGAAAREQQEVAERQRKETLAFAAPTAAELEGQHNMLQVSMAQNRSYQDQLAQQVMLMGALNPVITDAFLQASQIAQGHDSAYTSPYLAQMKIQQQKMQNAMQAQQGSGFAQGSAGAQASAMFAQQQSMGYMQVQQQAMQALQGLGTGAAGVLSQQGQLTNQTGSLASGTNQAYLNSLGSVQQRQVNASLGSGTAQYAGADQVANIMKGQAQQQFSSQAIDYLSGKNGQNQVQSLFGSAGGGGGGGGGGGMGSMAMLAMA